MAITVEIAEVDRTSLVLANTLSWYDALNSRSVLRFKMRDAKGGFRPVDGQKVEVKDSGVVQFSGLMYEPSEVDKGLLVFNCAATSYDQICDRRFVLATFSKKTLITIVANLNTNNLDGENITITGVETGGPKLSISFDGISVTEAFNKLAELFGKTWFIDDTKDLQFIAPSTAPSHGTQLNDTNLFLDTVTVTPDVKGCYLNRVIVAVKRLNSVGYRVVAAQDNDEIAARAAAEDGTSGIYERIFFRNDLADVDNVELRKVRDELLERYSVLATRLVGETGVQGFAAGQKVEVSLPDHGITLMDMLVTQVTVKIVGEEFRYRINAIGPIDDIRGPDPAILGPWIDVGGPDSSPTNPDVIIPSGDGESVVIPISGAVVHATLNTEPGWDLSATSGAYSFAPEGIGVSPDGTKYVVIRRGGVADTQGCGSGQFPGGGSSPACFTNRQTVVETYAIDATGQPSTTLIEAYSWDELLTSAFKSTVLVSPDGTLGVAVQPGSPGKFVVFDLVEGAIGSGLVGSVNTTMANNALAGEPVWLDDRIYWPDRGSADIFVFDVSDPANPTETIFGTTLSNIQAIVENGGILYAVGVGGLISLTAGAPPTEVDTEVSVGTYVSLAYDAVKDTLIMMRRDSATVLGFATVNVSGTTLTLDTNGTVTLSTPEMDGVGAIAQANSFMCWSSVDATGGVDTLDIHVFETGDQSQLVFVETIALTHAGTGNIGPVTARVFSGDEGFAKIRGVFALGDATEARGVVPEFITNVIARPFEVVASLPGKFGGTGVPINEISKGAILLGKTSMEWDVLPVAVTDGSVPVVEASDALGVVWGSHGAIAGIGNDDHTQYALLLGRSSGQTLIGGTAPFQDLHLYSNDSAIAGNKGQIRIGELSQLVVDEITSNVGIGTEAWGTTAKNVLAIGNGAVPTDSSALNVQLYAANYDGLNTSALHVRNEEGDLILFANGGVIGGLLTGGDLNLQSTDHATKGKILFEGAVGGAFDAVNDRFGIGTQAPSTTLHMVAPDAVLSTIISDTYSSTLGGPTLLGRHARGTIGSKSAVNTNDWLMATTGRGWHSGGAFSGDQARIVLHAAEAYTATNLGTYISLWVTPIGSTTLAERARLSPSGTFFINDVSNAQMTQGFSVLQDANDDQVFCGKSSDIAVPFTASIEADTFFAVQKATPLGGGAHIQGWSDDGSSAMILTAVQDTGDATKSTSGRGTLWINVMESDGGTGTQALDGTENLMNIANRGTTRFIFDALGNSHEDVGTVWTNFDIEDDIALLDEVALQLAPDRDAVKLRAMHALRPLGREWLESHRLVTFNANGHHFINRSRMQDLLIGATRQNGRAQECIGRRQDADAARINKLSKQLVVVQARLRQLEA